MKQFKTHVDYIVDLRAITSVNMSFYWVDYFWSKNEKIWDYQDPEHLTAAISWDLHRNPNADYVHQSFLYDIYFFDKYLEFWLVCSRDFF